jgi:hypothetical protein
MMDRESVISASPLPFENLLVLAVETVVSNFVKLHADQAV